MADSMLVCPFKTVSEMPYRHARLQAIDPDETLTVITMGLLIVLKPCYCYLLLDRSNALPILLHFTKLHRLSGFVRCHLQAVCSHSLDTSSRNLL